MPLTAREFDFVVRKFGFDVREGRHVVATLVLDGRQVARTLRSRQGSGDLNRWRDILKQLRLDEDEFREAHSCTLSRDEYHELAKARVD